MRSRNRLRSRCSSLFAAAAGFVKLGQPVPESNLESEENSSVAHPARKPAVGSEPKRRRGFASSTGEGKTVGLTESVTVHVHVVSRLGPAPTEERDQARLVTERPSACLQAGFTLPAGIERPRDSLLLVEPLGDRDLMVLGGRIAPTDALADSLLELSESHTRAPCLAPRGAGQLGPTGESGRPGGQEVQATRRSADSSRAWSARPR